MKRSFIQKLATIQKEKNSNIGLLIAPRVERMPLPIQRYDDPFLPFGKAVINATRDLVCAYMFDLAAYLVPGAAGAVALERTVDYVGEEAITILHGAFTLPTFASLMEETGFGVEAVTLASQEHLDIYTQREDRGVFIMDRRKSDLTNATPQAGLYLVEEALLTIGGEIGNRLQIRMTNEMLMYASRGEDFAEVIRNKIEQIRHG